MSGSGAVVGGVIALILSADSPVAGLLNRVHHPRRFIAFIVPSGAASAPPAS